MKHELKITKGKWNISDEILKIPTYNKGNFNRVSGISNIDVKMIKPENDYAVAYVFNHNGTQEDDATLISDAGTTYNKCGLLPSELLEQRDELLEVIKAARTYIGDGYNDLHTPRRTLSDAIDSAINKTTQP